MNMSKKVFQVNDVSLHDLEEHLNELAVDDWTLHSVYQIGSGDSSLPYFTVITHRPYDWEAHFEKKAEKYWEAELDAEKKAEKYWAAKIAENNGGHANE
tara:strand:+ start:1221 stop:1517 length:297 start_codon:yes stop_codon:yes gene_type:complete